jgi:hypothetical protein
VLSGALLLAKPLNLLNQRFGKLVATKYLGTTKLGSTAKTCSLWLCKCDCGGSAEVMARALLHANRRTCGCGANQIDEQLGVYSGLYREYNRSAKKRGLEFSLSKEEFTSLASGNCYYCGSEPALRKADRRKPIKSNGIDRQNNSQGYTFSNSRSCCKICNIAKSTLSFEEFIAWISKVYAHQLKAKSISISHLSADHGLQSVAGDSPVLPMGENS